ASSTTDTSAKSPVNTDGHLELGRRGEELAAAYLEQAGFRIVAANFVVPVGRNRLGMVINAEIDLVAYDGETLCFIEVKSRMSDWFAAPEANVDRRKQRQITRGARGYRRIFDLEAAPYRYDVITVVLPAEEQQTPDVQLLRNYWQEHQFRKRTWPERYWD
ncbi:MAG: YraN family protein, partial [Acidobacteriota bacterium]|nr:YraN family protein [Acidobacteriota bacterium]